MLEKQLFSTPKIYTANGDLKKRWYVYFSFRNPETGKLKRITPFYGNPNTYKTKEERLQVLSVYRKTLLKLLKQGYNQYNDNTVLFNKVKGKSLNSEKPKNIDSHQHNIFDKQSETETKKQSEHLKITEALELELRLKEKQVGNRTHKDYSNKVKAFLSWLEKNKPKTNTVDRLTKVIF